MSFPLPSDEPARLESLCRFKILDTPAEQGFDDLTSLAAHVCQAPVAFVSLVDSERQWFKSKVGFDLAETPRNIAFCSYTILQKDLFIVPDATKDERFADNPLVSGKPHIRFYAGAPLITDDGHAIGSLCVVDTEPRELDSKQKEALQALARQAIAQIMLRGQTIDLARTNDLLEQSKESYRVVAESASDVIITIDEQATILFANPAIERVLGYKAEDLINHDLSIIIPERLRAAHQAGMQRYLQTGERRIPWSGVELPAVRRDGQEIPVEVSFGENLDHNRRLFTAVIRDITERKRIEAELRKSEERYRFLAEAVPQQVWTADASGQLDYGNQRTIEYFEKKSENELLASDWLKVVHPADLEQSIERWTRAIETGEPYENEFRLRRADGEYRWHLAQAVPMRDENGQIVKWFGTNTDIHDRKLANEALRKSEEYHNLFQHANDAILIFEPETEVIIDVNDKACETYGIERAAFIGRSLKELSKDVAHGEQQLEALLVQGSYHEFETVQFRRDKTPIHFLVSSSLIEFNGQPAVLSINRDITARKQIEFEREQSQARLRESEELFRSFMNNNPAIGFMKDESGHYVYINETMERIYNVDKNDLIGKTDFDWLPTETAKQICQNDQKVLSADRVLEAEEVVPTPDGTMHRWQVFKFPFKDALGKRYIGGVATDITMRKRAEEQLLHDAFHDGLTGLPNRALFMDHLRLRVERNKRQRTNGELFAVLFLDFDRFKVINDSLGHAKGDKLLIMLARRLETSLRPDDLVARLSGDEFAILLNGLSNAEAASRIAERLQEHLMAPYDLDGRQVFISASIGITLSTSGRQSAEEMLRDADTAMYHAKAGGKARHQVFDQTMYLQAMTRLEMETELRRALERAEFCLYYQPIINLENNQLIGFEALIRWQHPERGLVPPSDFIPVAEENGLIIQLGEWTLHESCRQLREWQERNPAAASLTVSVNLSCKQFLQPNLAEQISQTLLKTRLAPNCLKLEITESHVMENTEAAVMTMNRLRALGVELSLDDFGTGYSSLSYLHRLPANFLKVDRSFVSRMAESEENYEIVHTIVKLAQNLKMKVVAEGIETDEQLILLKQLGCNYGQGYLLAKPLKAKAASEIIVRANSSNYAHGSSLL